MGSTISVITSEFFTMDAKATWLALRGPVTSSDTLLLVDCVPTIFVIFLSVNNFRLFPASIPVHVPIFC